MKQPRILLLILVAGSLTGAEMVYEMVTALPPLFSGVEANSTATLQMLIDEQMATVTNRADANRIVRKDMPIEKTIESGQGTGKWLLAKLTRYYEACLAVRDTLELYTPAAEHKALLTDGERYGAEWHITLQTMTLSRWSFPDLPKTRADGIELSGAARRQFAGVTPLPVQ